MSSPEPMLGIESLNNQLDSSSTIYVPIVSPPTPAPSPRPIPTILPQGAPDIAHLARLEFAALTSSGATARQHFLASVLSDCTPAELLFVYTTIAPLLKRDFLRELPPELSLHILGYIDEPRTLSRASRVSKHWQKLVRDEPTWRRLCGTYHFGEAQRYPEHKADANGDPDNARNRLRTDKPLSTSPIPVPAPVNRIKGSFSFKEHFETSYKTMTNWRSKGRILRTHRPPSATPDGGVVTSVAMDDEWIVAGLANARIHVFSAKTGVLSRTLIGHENGVWTVNLVSRGGYWANPPGTGTASAGEAGARAFDASAYAFEEKHIPATLRAAIGLDRPRMSASNVFGGGEKAKPSDICSASEGWGQANALVVSGGCDKVLRVWDVKSGYCIYVLRGHTSTIRCMRVLHNRPIAVSGSRDTTLRVWDVQRGEMLRVLQGHEESVRCLDVCGNTVVSGSYDCTCRLWNVDTGECLQVLRGHFHQIYSVAYDGVYIASGGLDTTVRVWDPDSGECLTLLQGHTALVCQLQLSGDTLATGGSDGRVITFSLARMAAQHRIAAHDSSVTALQFDAHFLVTGGNDGRVRLFEAATGNFVRDLTQPADAVWKVAHRHDKCVIMCRRAGKTVMEIWSFRPEEEDD